MSPHPFRFGLVAATAPHGQSWADQARRAESLGYAAIQVPDTLGTLASFPALAAAAAVTSTLRVGNYVLAVPNHRPAEVAHQALTLDILSGGRFDLGLGAGRPDAGREAEQLGVPFGSPGERIDRLSATIEAVRARYADPAGPLQPVQKPHPPLMIAANGGRMLRLAAAEADIVALGLPIESGVDVLAAKAAELRQHAGERADRIELALSLFVIGDGTPPWLAGTIGADPARLHQLDAATAVRGTPAQMAEVLRRRRDQTGVSYLQINAIFMEEFAPVVQLLAGT
ncbi:MAG TPA: LLM class flavin-dependent oxidoreductase [Actinocrinis sp.]|nr:LLM class flavin-dependent oxidoreductase [Actinocrinis sp.]